MINHITKERWKPKKTIKETIRKELKINELNSNIIYDIILWRSLIHLTDPI